MSDFRTSIGLVAIGRNEGERLKRCLRSVPAHIPLVYVDSASTDDSVAFARARQALVVELDMAIPFSAARARNEGLGALLARHPQIEFVQFVDGDCELEADWLDTAAKFLKSRPPVGAVCGRRRERYPDASIYNRMCDEEWNTPVGRADACGGDAMLRVHAFQQVGGYDPAMIAGEEPELCQRLRGADWQIWRLDAPMTVHDADMHAFRQYWNRAIRSGFGYAQVFHKTKAGDGDILYRREVISALFWTFGVAMVALLLAAIFGALGLLISPAIWWLQWLRLGRRHGFAKGGHMLTGKVAEAAGILRYWSVRIRGRSQGAIFYK
ncbi:glycosyltransferase [Sphingorhabdus sp.]|uniref:glycosyltransferase n=1 Tax=Sphingorhabdus sp. TaxID=1902408 RepID=UPI00391C7A24